MKMGVSARDNLLLRNFAARLRASAPQKNVNITQGTGPFFPVLFGIDERAAPTNVF